MLPVLAAGIVFGFGALIGQKYGEEIIIPAAEKVFGKIGEAVDNALTAAESAMKALDEMVDDIESVDIED